MPAHPLPPEKLSCSCGTCKICRQRVRQRARYAAMKAGTYVRRPAGKPRGSQRLACECGHCSTCWSRKRSRRIADERKAAGLPPLPQRRMIAPQRRNGVGLKEVELRLEQWTARRRAAWAEQAARFIDG